MKASRLVARLLFIVTLLCALIAVFLLAKAGEVGDTKSGLGDWEKAAELEGVALYFIVGTSLSIGGICAAISRTSIVLRILLAILVAAASLVVFLFIVLLT